MTKNAQTHARLDAMGGYRIVDLARRVGHSDSGLTKAAQALDRGDPGGRWLGAVLDLLELLPADKRKAFFSETTRGS